MLHRTGTKEPASYAGQSNYCLGITNENQLVCHISKDKESCRKALEEAGARKVAFVYHLKIRDSNGYDKWLSESKIALVGKDCFELRPIRSLGKGC